MKAHDPERPAESDVLSARATTPLAQNDAPRPYRRRQAAAQYVRDRWGLPCQPSWLAKLAVLGGGPVFRRCGRFPVYDEDALDAWARSRLSGPMRSTSDAA
jgi:hypothetical protein